MPALKITTVTLLFLLALLVGHQNAQAGWSATDTDPAMVVSHFNHRAFSVGVEAGTGYGGAAALGGVDSTVWLTQLAYRGARRGDGYSVWVLLHETGHTLGIADEHAASVWGYQHLVAVLREFYGQTLAQARNGYRSAVEASRSDARVYQP